MILNRDVRSLNAYVTALIDARFKLRQQEAAAAAVGGDGDGGTIPARRQDILDQTMGAIDPTLWTRASVEQIRDEVSAGLPGFWLSASHPHARTHARPLTSLVFPSPHPIP
jgi:hypothetical protein